MMTVTSAKLARYDKRIKEKVHDEHSDKETPYTGFTDQTTLDFVNDRYIVLKDFIPKEIITMTLDAWKVIENNPDQQKLYFGDREVDIIQESPQSSLEKSHGAYCFPPAVALHHYVRNKLRDYLNLKLRETYSYTRKYYRGAYLKAHSDRPSCEISVTLCLDYKTDDNTPWTLWGNSTENWILKRKGQETLYEETQALKNRDRVEAGSVRFDLEPGDIFVYQGPNIAHWRDYLLGEYSYHVFLHFINDLGKVREMPDATYEMTWDNKAGINAEPRTVLDFDGRRNRYDTDDESPEKKRMADWLLNVYEGMDSEEVAKYINNFTFDEVKRPHKSEKYIKKPSEVSPDYVRPENNYPATKKGG